MLVISLLFITVFILLVYALKEDTGKNTHHSRNQKSVSQAAHKGYKKKPLRMGDSLF